MVMKKVLVYVTLSILMVTGCGKKVTPPKKEPIVVDTNKTVEVEIVEEEIVPEAGVFDWQQNDELISEGMASKLVIVKSKRVMVLFDEVGNILSRHRVSLGKNPVGTKLKQGDNKTPEGTYHIVVKRSDPKYYKEILISYPNSEDRARSRSMGFNPGGGITFHAQVPWNWDGHLNDYTLDRDWTIGCVAMTNEGMDSIWNKLSKSTIIEIRE